MNEHAPGADADDAHAQLVGYVAFCRRTLQFWRVPVAALLLGGIAAAAFLLIRKPTYRSETVILYSEGVRPPDDEDRPENARSVAVRMKEILMSRAALDTVVREFDLFPDVRRTRGPVDAVEELRKRVEYRAPGGDTFSIAFTGASPVEAQRVTARLAELAIDRDSQLRKTRAVVTRDFLEQEERATEQDLREKEQALATFMGAHPRFAFDATPSVTGAAFRASLGPAAAPGRQPTAMPRLRSDGTTVASPGTAVVGNGASSPAAEEGRAAAAVAAARTNLAELMTRFTPAHPDVRAAAAEVERAEGRLAAAKGTPMPAAPSVPTDQPSLSVQAPPKPAPVPASPPRPSPRVASSPPPSSGAKEPETVALETEWVKLTRAVTEARQHQDHIEAALFKASLAASSESGGHGIQVTVIDPAFLPEKPVPPGRTTIAGVFAAVSVLLGIIGAALFAIFDDRIHSGREVGPLLPVLAEIPRPFSRRAHATS